MSDAAKAEGATETDTATKSAAAHRLDTTSINEQRRALEMLTDSAKRSQQWTEWGGRNDPGAHLSDLAKTLEYKRLINIQNWLTFTNPQSAFAFREKERQQAIQMNYAVWGGYTTPDQYLGYLQRQRTGLASINDVLLNRAQIYRDNASAALSYENALSGTHATAGTLSEHLDLSGISQFQSALAGLPDTVTTRLAVDDATAIAELAKYQALLKGVPREVSTSEVVTAATLLGGVSLDTKPQIIPVSYGGPYKQQFAAILSEVAALSKLHAQIPVHFELPSASEVASFVSQIPAAGITEPVHLAPQGGAVGVGAGPPPQVIAAWNALRGAEDGAATEAKLASSAETVAGDAAAGAVPKVTAAAAAWEKLGAAQKDAAEEGAAAGKDAAAADEAAWQARVARIGAYYDALVKADAETLHTAKDFVPPPAAAQAWEQLTLGVDGFTKAVDAAAVASGWQQLTLDTEYLSKDAAAWTALTAVEDKATAGAARFVAGAKEIVDLNMSTVLVPLISDWNALTGAEQAAAAAEKEAKDSAAATAAELYALAAAANNSTDAVRLTIAAQEAEKIAAGLMGAAAVKAAAGVNDLTSAYEKLSAAEKDAAAGAPVSGGGAGKPPTPPPAAATPAPGAEPPPDAAAKWAALSSAEKAAGLSAADAAAKLRELSAAAIKAADAAHYDQAAKYADAVANSRLSDSAKSVALGFLAQALAAKSALDAVQFAKVAVNNLAVAEKQAGTEATVAAVGLEKSGVQAKQADGLIRTLAGAWGFLQTKISLFGGAFGGTFLLGTISAWHLGLDMIIEALAVLIPAIVTAAAGLVAFGLAGAHAANDIVTHLKAVQTVSSALGQDIPPLAFHMKALTDSMKAPVVELYGGAINALGSGMGLLAPLAQKTASLFENWTARMDLWLARSGPGIHHFLAVGSADLKQFGDIASSVAQIFIKFLQATAMTQVAEKLLGLLALAFRGVADVIKLIPAPLLAFGIGIHAAIIYGGLFANTLKSIALAVDGVAAKIPGLSQGATTLAQHLGASQDQLAKMGSTPYLKNLITDISQAKQNSYDLAKGAGLADDTIVKLVSEDPKIQAVAKSLGMSATSVANMATSFAKNGISVDEMAAKVVGGENALNGLTGKFKDAEKEAANLAVYMAGSPESAAAAVGKLDTAFGQAAKDAEKSGTALASVGSWISANWVLVGAAVVAGLAYIVYWSQQADKVTKQFISNIDSGLSQLSASQAWAEIPNQISIISTVISGLGKSAMGTFGQMQQGWKQAGVGLTEFFTDFYRAGTPFQWLTGQGKAWGDTFMGILHGLGVPIEKNKQDIQALTAEQQKLVDQWTTLSREALLLASGQDTVAGKGYSVAQAFGLMDLAGVKATDSFALMKQKVDNLVTGWVNLGVQGGMLANSVNALTLQTGLQQSKINDLTGAWDAFFAIVNKGPADFVSFAKSLAQVGTDAKVAGANMQDTSAQSLTLRGDFLSAASGAQQLLDQLMLQNAAAGNTADGYNKVTAAGKDIIRTMIPLASGQQDLNQLFAIAQQAGYQGAESYKAIAQWAGTATGTIKSAKDPMSQLNTIESQLDTSSANLANDVKNLADAIDTNLNNAVAAAIVKFPGLQKAADNFFGDLQSHQGDVAKGVFPPDLQTAGVAWWKTLVGIYGTGGQKAHDAFIAEVMAADPGLTQKQAQALWQQVSTDFNNQQKKTPATVHLGMDTTGAQKSLSEWNRLAATPPSTKNWSGFWGQIGGFFNNDVFMPVDRFVKSSEWANLYTGFMRDFGSKVVPFFTGTVHGIFTHDIPGWWDSLWTGNMQNFHQQVWTPLVGFFGGSGTVHGWFTHDIPSWWNGLWSANMQDFHQNVYLPFIGFFNGTVHQWFTHDIPAWWHGLWSANMQDFHQNVWVPLVGFFNGTVHQWFTHDIPAWWNGLWSGNMKDFHNNVWNPLVGFFGGSGTVHQWFTHDIPGWWNSLWSGNMASFRQTVWNPLVGFFTNTVPGAVDGAFKRGIDNSVRDINQAIQWINDVTGVVGIPPIHKVNIPFAGFAGGGSVAGTGDEDGTHIIAMGGEYMVRKPARMALEAKYGRNFMNTLNQADTWLGSGSRGNVASQQPPHGARRMAAGGNADPVGSWARPERIDMGVDYGGAGPLYAISHGTITNLYNSGWPGGAFIGLRMDQGAKAGQYWYYAEDIAPLTSIGATVNAGQHIANATGGGSGIELGFAAPPGSGMTMAAATGEQSKSGDPGAVSTGWGVAASDFIKSLGGPGGILQGKVSGGTPGIAGGLGFISVLWQSVEGLLNAAGDALSGNLAPLAGYVTGGAKELLSLAKQGGRAVFDTIWNDTVQPLINKALPGGDKSAVGAFLQYAAKSLKNGVDGLMGAKDSAAQSSAAATNAAGAVGPNTPGHGLVPANAAPIAAYLASHGLNRNAIAGILGNIEQESGGDPNAGSNPPGRGLIQILGDPGGTLAQDLPRVMAYIAANGSVADINAHASTPTEAAVYFSAKYERPGNPQIQNRIAAAVASAAAGYAQGGKVGLPSSAGLVGLPSSSDPDVYTPHPDGPNLHLHSGAPGNATLGDMWMNSGGLQQLTGLGWAPYDLPPIPSASGGELAGLPPSVALTGGPAIAWGEDALGALGAPGTTADIQTMVDWFTNEGTPHDLNNPLNLQTPYGGSVASSADGDPISDGIQAYPVPADFVAAFPIEMNNGSYGALVSALKAGTGLENTNSAAIASALSVYSGHGYNSIPASWSKSTPIGNIGTSSGTSGGGAARTYVVRAGDTLASVAAKFGISRVALAHANGLGTGAGLRTGRILSIPAAGAPVAPAPAPAPAPGPPAAAGSSGMTPVEAWAFYSNKLGADRQTQSDDFWNLQLNAPLPSTATTQQWESDYAWLLILRGQQNRLADAFNTINTDLGTPGSLGAFAGASDWQNLANQAATQESWIGGNIPPRSAWKDENLGAWPAGYPVGQITPSGWASWKYQNNAWTQAKNSIDAFKTDVVGAQGAWNALYGPSGSISTSAPTPGVQVQPAGNTGPIVIDLQSLITGGAYAPVSAVAAGIPLSATGSGFAAGGPLPSISMAGAAAGGEVSMADVANMFAVGGSIPVLPARSGPQGLVGSLDRMQNGQGNARSITSSAGDSIGVNVGNLTINNPVAEKPSDSITRSSNRLAFLAGRGPV